ncbi:MAG TPA: HAD-IA family hydrolase [Streptosporangiaceae bacterium]|nr:HAD-IA family hydrolase [Streptosporangiaceae bacterium]
MNWVMFDYGGVISHPPAQQDLVKLAKVAGAAVPAFVDVYWEWRRAYDLAELDVTEYWRQVGRSLDRSYGQAEISELARLDCAAWLRLQPGTLTLIEDLAAAGLPLALLSNAPDELAEAIRALPIAARFGQLIFSCQLKLAKPDPRCYGTALARLGASAGEVIFIDDRAENVTAAADLGLLSVHFTSPERVRAAVTERLVGRG